MTCPIRIIGVEGTSFNSQGEVTSIKIVGEVTSDIRNCEIVEVRLVHSPDVLVEETSVAANGEFDVTFDLTSVRLQDPIECGEGIKVEARCIDAGCDPVSPPPFRVQCFDSGVRPLYVSYYDCEGWDSVVEVMNLQNDRATFIITVYHRTGNLVWQRVVNAAAHETKQIPLDSPAPRNKGLVIVAPRNDGDEFPSMLCITNESIPPGLPITTTQLQRFVPFIRIPHERRVI